MKFVSTNCSKLSTSLEFVSAETLNSLSTKFQFYKLWCRFWTNTSYLWLHFRRNKNTQKYLKSFLDILKSIKNFLKLLKKLISSFFHFNKSLTWWKNYFFKRFFENVITLNSLRSFQWDYFSENCWSVLRSNCVRKVLRSNCVRKVLRSKSSLFIWFMFLVERSNNFKIIEAGINQSI